ncbi:MAG: hypothetical protein L0216_20875 [Planctomycetales bacterium]|nr:hypothetical protein [Planctomycetales bacterium]
MKVTVHKIASVTANLRLAKELEITRQCRAEAGNVVVVRALEEKTVYNQLELDTGRMAKISKEDIIAAALGRRRALRGFVGDVPAQVRVGDKLHVLNLGGVIGLCSSENKDVGRPLQVEVLGMAVNGNGKILNIAQGALAPRPTLGPCVPLIMVSGTCMNAGKTAACCEIIQKFTSYGYSMAGVKLTGVACLRDTLNMEDHGARWTRSFLDCGLSSTVGVSGLPAIAKALLADLSAKDPDAIVVELGDGIVGAYGPAELLADPEIRAATKAHVICATDLVAAWGAVKIFDGLGIKPDVIAGPATDNEVGVQYIERDLGIPARNARVDPWRLAELVEKVAFGEDSAAPPPGEAAAESYGQPGQGEPVGR